jgi:hypothetical protein
MGTAVDSNSRAVSVGILGNFSIYKNFITKTDYMYGIEDGREICVTVIKERKK